MTKVDDQTTTPARRKRQTRAAAPEVMPLPPAIPERPETSEEVAQSKE